jgi:Domain of unknown function (DUF4279)
MAPISWSVKLALFSETANPDELTKLAGIEPDFTALAGSTGGSARLPRRFNHWELRSRLDPTSDLERHIDALLQRVASNMSEVFRAGEKGGGFELSIVGRLSLADDSSPGINLTSQQLRTLAELGASVDIEFIYRDA